MSLVTDEIRASASEIYHGDDMCQVKSKFLLTEVGLPNGLLPLQDMVECGYVKDTGFVWLTSKKKTEHKFEKINKLVHYASEVTAYVEPNRIKKLTGVKAKELLLWITLSEIKNDPENGSIIFKTPAGLSRTFPFDAFVIEDSKDVKAAEANEIADKIGGMGLKEVEGKNEAVEKKDLVGVAAKNEGVEVKEV